MMQNRKQIDLLEGWHSCVEPSVTLNTVIFVFAK